MPPLDNENFYILYKTHIAGMQRVNKPHTARAGLARIKRHHQSIDAHHTAGPKQRNLTASRRRYESQGHLYEIAARARRLATFSSAIDEGTQKPGEKPHVSLSGNLKVVGRLGGDLDNIELNVYNTIYINRLLATGANRPAVAQYAVTAALMLIPAPVSQHRKWSPRAGRGAPCLVGRSQVSAWD